MHGMLVSGGVSEELCPCALSLELPDVRSDPEGGEAGSPGQQGDPRDEEERIFFRDS